MNKFSIRLLSVFLTVAILIVSLPLTVFALTSTDTDSGSLVSSDNEYVSNGDITELLELRTADTKYFRLNDGSYYAAMYDTDVHYLDNDGVWQDIDNRLEVCGSEISTSNEKIKFAQKTTGNSSLFTIHNGNKKLTLSLNGVAKKVEGRITNTDEQVSENQTVLGKMTTLGNISASVIYEDILSGVDLEYVIRGSDIKENIIVKERSDSYSYAFTMSLNNMTAVLDDGGHIVISDSSDDSVVYVIPAPVMWDAAGCVSNSVYITLENHGNGKYTLTVIADRDWINDGERVFPITVDPPIYADPDYPVVDTSISSVNRATSYSSLTYLSVSDTMHSYWKLNKLPSLPRGYYITDAELSFNCISDSESIGYVGLYDVLTDWDSTLTWNKVASTGSPAGKPADDFSDFNLVNGAGTYRWNVTEQVKEWYTDTNYGVMLAPIAGTSCLGTLQFGSNDYASELSRPKLCISYQILRGIEDYWSFTSQGVGFAGSGAVNNAVGNLVYTIPTLTTTDALMPFTPTLVYDSSIRDTDYTYGSIQTSYASTFTAKGYKLNISETLLKKSYISENDVTKYMFIWSDADGTEHYFMPTGTPGTYTDEAGMHLTLAESTNQCTIKDDSDNVRYFSKQSSTPSNAISGWYLTSVEDQNGNKLSFGFDSSNRPTSVKLIPSGDEEIVQLRLSYTTAGYLYAVWNPTSGEGIVLRYSSVRTGSTSTSSHYYLRYVVRAHGANTEAQWLAFYNTNSNSSTSVVTVDGVGEYTYGTYGLLTAQNHLSRYKVTYDYDTSGRVTSVTESAGTDNTVGQQISLSYGTSSVVIRTSGKDDIFNNEDDLITTYGFDKSARVVSCYTTDLDRTQIYGASNGQYVGDENENAKNNLKSSVQTAGQSSNYLLNGGFEATSSGIPYWSSTGLASLDSVMAYSGQKCAELCVNDTIDGSTLYQTVSLPKGEYSLSFKVNTHDSNGLILFVRVEPTILGSDTYVQQDIPVNEYYATGAYAFAGVNFTVTP